MWFQLPRKQVLPSLRQAWLHLTPLILRVFKEIHIGISKHIIVSNFKRISRTSHHPWKLQFTSTLIFQSIVVLPLKEIYMCLWGHIIVQMVDYPENLSFHISLMHLLCMPWSSLTTWRGEFGKVGSRQGRWMQPVLKGHTHVPPTKLLISIDEVWAGVPTPHSQVSLECDGPSQTGIILMRWRDKMDHCGFTHKGEIPFKDMGMRKDSHLSCHLQQKLLKSNWKVPQPLNGWVLKHPTLTELSLSSCAQTGQGLDTHTHFPGTSICLFPIPLLPHYQHSYWKALEGGWQYELGYGGWAGTWQPSRDMVAEANMVTSCPWGHQEVRAGVMGAVL